MKLYCRYKEMRFGDSRFPEGLIITNYSTQLDDEVASRLALDHPDIFSVKAFARLDRIESLYDDGLDDPPSTDPTTTDEDE